MDEGMNIDSYDVKSLSTYVKNLGYDLVFKDVVESTLNLAFTEKSKKSSIILTNHQTNGIGRYSNYWLDKKNKSVLMTIVEKKTAMNDMDINLLSHLISLQVCLALKSIAKTNEIKIKWPNDILFSGKKIAGILIERNEDTVSIGVGVNIYEDIVEGGTCLHSKGVEFCRQEVVLCILKKIHNLSEEINSVLSEDKIACYGKLWMENSYILNRKIFMSLRNFSLFGIVKESFLGENIIIESESGRFSISEKDYIPGSCVIG